MVLETIDWIIITVFFVISIGIGIYSSKKSSKSTKEFFLSGKNMPWWLLGTSMVATTFSNETPLLVTDITRQNGIVGNWVWWAFLLTGMLTVFVYAKLWQRSGVMTDLEFYEMRYSGKLAGFLRGFRAVYLGLIFNILILATVSMAMTKIAAVLLGWTPIMTLLIAGGITLIYSSIGGLRGVILTDFFQFFLSMVGAIWAANYILDLPEIGSLENLFAHENVADKLSFFPDFSNTELMITLIVLPLAVQWWSVWYPGGEPGGGGYVAQRMLSAKSEKDSALATLYFNLTHYAIRPWPWFIVALASLIIYPNLESLRAAFPNVDPSLIRHDFAYPAMIKILPSGLIGLVMASLFAAFMSTVSTHLNWGASYLVNDLYSRFIKPEATEKQLLIVGRFSMLIILVLSLLFALALSNALQAFHIILQIGAGTGLIYILRWFWWRINAASELTAMIVSFLLAMYFQFLHPIIFSSELSGSEQLIYGVLLTTISWVFVAFKSKSTDELTLVSFYKKIQSGGPGWKKIRDKMGITESAEKWDVGQGVLAMFVGTIAIFSFLFSIGKFLYGDTITSIILLIVFLIGSVFVIKTMKSMRFK
jgi:solute:Na+ symporter, SSS family